MRSRRRSAAGALVPALLVPFLVAGCGDGTIGPSPSVRYSETPLAIVDRVEFPDTHGYSAPIRLEPDPGRGESATWDPAWADAERYRIEASAVFVAWNSPDLVPVEAYVGGRASSSSVAVVVRPRLGRFEIGGLRNHEVRIRLVVREVIGN